MDTKTFKRGMDAYTNPGFYRQLGKRARTADGGRIGFVAGEIQPVARSRVARLRRPRIADARMAYKAWIGRRMSMRRRSSQASEARTRRGVVGLLSS